MTEFGSQVEHEKYDELCALATAGVLTPAEAKLLSEHLELCAQCREAFAQYQDVAADGMSFLAVHYGVHAPADGFDESSAFKRLLQTTKIGEPQALPMAAVAGKKQVSNRGWVRGLAAAS